MGHARPNTLGGLRSLFAFAKRKDAVFRNPTAGIKVGEHRHTVIGPLSPGELAGAIATATVPQSAPSGQGGAAPPSPQPSEVSASTASSTRPSPTDPIPLHIAAELGLDQKTAIRYATSARQLLEPAAERHTVSTLRSFT